MIRFLVVSDDGYIEGILTSPRYVEDAENVNCSMGLDCGACPIDGKCFVGNKINFHRLLAMGVVEEEEF